MFDKILLYLVHYYVREGYILAMLKVLSTIPYKVTPSMFDEYSNPSSHVK